MKNNARQLSLVTCLFLSFLGAMQPGSALAGDPKPGTLSGGAALGFLGNTPEATAFALNFHGDLFVNPELSVGPLLQLAFTGNLTQVGLSAQGKYWWTVPTTDNRGKLVLQAGIGFVNADRGNGNSDTSFLIPLGVGLDYQLNKVLAVNVTFLLNFTDLETGPGQSGETNVMPGLTFGFRF